MLMKLPSLNYLATASAIVQIADGTDENGAPKIVKEIQCDCRVEQENKTVYLKDGRQVTLMMKLFIFDKLDEFPTLEKISGFCTIFNYKYDIAIVKILLNPDGSRNHIVLELM